MPMPIQALPPQAASASAVASSRRTIEQEIAALTVQAYLASGVLPDTFICPILRTLMRDPVCTPHATYERSAIARYLSGRRAPADPVTGLRLANVALTPNQAIKTQIFVSRLRLRRRGRRLP